MQADLFNTPDRNPSNSGLTAFDFEGVPVRVTDIHGEAWWLLTDVCRVLEISNTGNASARLDGDQKSTIRIADSGNLNADRVIVNESGLYSLVFASRKPAAQRFRKWVASDVLPAIRRTGSYHLNPAPEPARARQMTMAEMTLAVIGNLQGQVAEQAATIHAQNALLNANMPKAAVYDRIADADGSMCISDAAKTLGIGPQALFRWMSANAWIFKRGRGASWLGREEKAENGTGYLTHIATTVLRPDGREIVTKQVRVTAKGLARLARLVPGARSHAAPVAVASERVQHGGYFHGRRRSVHAGMDPDDIDALGRHDGAPPLWLN
ncbi:phage antirepressor KilAC domain-containing protein [Gluconacetobacter sacchari]|uniref:Phage repressor protein/antirepressor Ant n=2 Tax=Gluconacetobacter sacchari TaxID=92759 RepID=A0A7W4NJK5_9PROT|nr:phage antirepressor KilAC domain-containing protein [Gluconacetobacter sacchari]MBB2158984.1 phage repressor protein/antirepressor Ant [Gluconacetobacter sacchari]